MDKPTTIRFGNTRKKAEDLMDHYGLKLSGLIRFLISRAWNELKK